MVVGNVMNTSSTLAMSTSFVIPRFRYGYECCLPISSYPITVAARATPASPTQAFPSTGHSNGWPPWATCESESSSSSSSWGWTEMVGPGRMGEWTGLRWFQFQQAKWQVRLFHGVLDWPRGEHQSQCQPQWLFRASGCTKFSKSRPGCEKSTTPSSRLRRIPRKAWRLRISLPRRNRPSRFRLNCSGDWRLGHGVGLALLSSIVIQNQARNWSLEQDYFV